MTKIMMFALIVILFGMRIINVKASENQNSLKKVRVSCGINNALYIDEDGQVKGYCSEYLQQLAKINHWDLEYVEASWSDSVQNFYDGKIDLLFPTQMTEERIGKMGFSTAIGGYQPIGLFARADADLNYNDYKNFDGTRIAVSEGTSNEQSLNEYAEKNGFTFTPVYLNSTEDKLNALKDGTVDLIVFSTLNDVKNGKVVGMLNYLPFYYVTRIDDTELLEQLNSGMKEILIRNPELVQQVFYDFMNKDISFAYTREEENAIQEQGTIVIGVFKDTPPLYDVDEDGNDDGIYVDLIHRIQEISGLDIEIRPLNRKEKSFEKLESGELDFIIGSSDQTDSMSDNQEWILSEGIMDYYTVQITSPKFSKNEKDEVIYALTRGRKYAEERIRKTYPEANFIYFDNSKECIKAVQKGSADATLLNSWEYNYQSKNPRFQQLMEWENSRTLSKSVLISADTQNSLIQSVIDKSIEQIDNSEKEAIITGNLNKPYASYDFEDYLYEMSHMLQIAGFVLIALFVAFLIYVLTRRKYTRELEIKNAELIDANDAKTKFMSRMSHELRTPLNAITGYATVTKQAVDKTQKVGEEITSNQDAILRAASYQMAIIGELLDVQKVESGQVKIEKEKVDFAGYMSEIVEMIQTEASEKKIDFSYEKLSNLNTCYMLDGVHLQQVLLNILHNAVKFTDKGGKVKLSVEVINQDEKVNTLKFVISDTGIGMSEDFQNHYLFKQFAQEYQGNTSPYEGCGIGLALSKDIMHLMGGDITCVSEKGVGSVFTIILSADYVKKRTRRERKEQIPYDLSGIHILLCEDNPMNQDMEKRLLERMHCSVEIADDGQIGLDKFKNSALHYFHIIFMDIRMPNMDGIEATKMIRSLDREDAKTVPILAVSANAFREDVNNSIQAGMNEHLAKPVDARILYQKIVEYCKKDLETTIQNL